MTTSVSVIIATYNYGKYIIDCLESLKNQTLQNLEIIIVDDGSTDNTATLVKEFADERIRYFFQVNKGQASAKNIGIKESIGKYICFLDSDDYLDINSIEERALFLDTNQSVDWVFTDTYFVDSNKQILCKGSEVFSVVFDGQFINNIFQQLLKKGNFITSDTVMLRKKCLEFIGNFNGELRFHEDYELWLRLAKQFRCGYINKPLNFMRKHQHSLGTADYEIDRIHMVRLMDHLETLYPDHINKIKKIWNKRKADAINHLGIYANKRFDYNNMRKHFLKSIKQYPYQFLAYRYLIKSLIKTCMTLS